MTPRIHLARNHRSSPYPALALLLCCSLLLADAFADAQSTDNSWSLSLSGTGLATSPTVITSADSSSPNYAVTVFADLSTPAPLSPASNWQWLGGNATMGSAPSGTDADVAWPSRRFFANTWYAAGVLQVWSGFGETILTDAWNYDRKANRWSQISDSIALIQGTRLAAGVSSPGPRFGSTTAYDPATGRRWLWSGQSAQSYRGELYSWDGVSASSWTLHTGPLAAAAAPRYPPTMGSPIDGALTTDKDDPTHFQPGGRRYAAGWFSQGCMLMFGGQTSLGAKDDLWAYRVADDKLIWVAGSTGTDAAAITPNNPYPRYFATAVGPDAQGKMYLFGGYQAYTGYSFSDLWSLTVTSDCTAATWTLLSGSQLDHDGPGTYGNSGEYSALNLPPARNQAYGALDYAGSALLIYGGSSVSADISSLFADCWRLDLTTLQWAWIRGPQGPTKLDPTFPAGSGVSSADSNPGTRFSGSAFVDESGSLWMAFGFGNTARNDLWRLARGSASVSATINLPAGATINSRSLSATAQTNTIVLLEAGSTFTAYFTVTAESGAVSPKYAVALASALNTAVSWTASANWAALPAQARSSADNSVVSLPYQALPADLGLVLTLPYGASISPASLSVVRSATAVGSTDSYSFTVTSQSGASSGVQTISWIVLPNTDNSWSGLVTVPGVEMRSLDSATSDAADGIFELGYASALAEITLALSLPFGATVIPAAASPSTTLQLGGGGSVLRYEFSVSAQSGATNANAPFVLQFRVANNTDHGWNATVTPFAGAATTVVSSTGPLESRVFQLPLNAAHQSASIALTPAPDATVEPTSPLSLALGGTGSTSYANFTVRAQSGASSGLISLVFIVAPSNSTDWAATVSVPGMEDRVFTQNSTEEQRAMYLPESAARQAASIVFTVTQGQSIDVGFSPSVTLGYVNSSTLFSFAVTSQTGSATVQSSFRFIVAESTAEAWSLLITPPAAGQLAPRRVNSSSALSDLVFLMPAEAVGSSVGLDFTLAENTTFVSSSSAAADSVALTQSVTLGASNATTLYRFTMRAGPGAPDLTHTLRFVVAPSSNRSWSLLVSSASTSVLSAPIRVSSESPASALSVTVPTHAAGALLSLALTLSPGARLAQTSSGFFNLTQSMQLGDRDTTASFSFAVQAESGDQSELHTLHVRVAAVDLNAAGARAAEAQHLVCTLMIAAAAVLSALAA